MQDDIFEVIEAARITPDGKACVRKAREIASWAETKDTSTSAKVELLAEARQWLRAGLEHDKATDTTLLREIRDRLDKKDARRRELQAMREEAKRKEVEGPPQEGGATNGAA